MRFCKPKAFKGVTVKLQFQFFFFKLVALFYVGWGEGGDITLAAYIKFEL